MFFNKQNSDQVTTAMVGFIPNEFDSRFCKLRFFFNAKDNPASCDVMLQLVSKMLVFGLGWISAVVGLVSRVQHAQTIPERLMHQDGALGKWLEGFINISSVN